MAHLDKKVEFAEQENIEDCKAFRTGSMGDKEQRMSRFRRLTSGSLRHKRQAGHMTTTKTDLIDPTHCIDPLHTFFNSDTEVSDSGVPRINNTAYMNNGRRPKRYRRSCRSAYETPNYSTALGPLREKHKLTPLERIFLEAAERGDKSTLVRCLSFSNGVNVNCVNILGRTAIQIAVDNENIELVELLLEQPGIEIGDAILYAIQEGVYRIVEMLIDHPSITKEMLGTSWTTQCIGIGKREEESHDFSTDISPVMLAAICNQFEILQLLINRGARIEEPHKSSCSCEHCHRLLSDDPLKHTLQRINTYRALASPAWMSLTSPDPILTAFELSSELLHLASRENEFKEIFLSLCEQCRKYACDLLDLCRELVKLSLYSVKVPIVMKAVVICPHQQGSHDNGDASNCSQCENNNQNYAANENDWRELLDRSNFSRRRHHRRFTAWNHSSYSCAKFNQALSLESQHSINEDFVGTDNLHPSTSKTEYLNYTDKSINDGEQLKIAVSHTASYSTAKFPSCIAKEKRNFQDFTSDNNDCNNIGETDDKSKAVTKETILNEGLPSTTNTSEGCSSIFLNLNTGIDTTHCKHGLYKRNSFSNPNNIICCCFPHYRCCKCSKSQTKKDLSLNRHSEKKHLKSETSEIESFGVKKHRKFYSFKLDRLKLAIKHEQKKFVAHPHCQHLLTTLWYDQLPGWRKRHPFTKLFLCFCFIIALPILAPTYLIHPHDVLAN
ncbi:unnamed protein product [Heterobilharzia americana]|nr:unnamed protein product [Heterobilharzia americana]